MMITSEMILEQTTLLNNLLDNLLIETISLNGALRNLEFTEADIVANGIEGKNAETRKANLALATIQQRENVDELRSSVGFIRHDIDKVRNVLSAYKLIVQLAA